MERGTRYGVRERSSDQRTPRACSISLIDSLARTTRIAIGPGEPVVDRVCR